MKASELRTKSVEELNKELAALCKEQFSLRMQNVTGQLPKNHVIKNVRRGIARVKTLITEKAGEKS